MGDLRSCSPIGSETDHPPRAADAARIDLRPRWMPVEGHRPRQAVGIGTCCPSDRTPEEPPMATFVLIPGAGSTAWYWHLVEPELRGLGHDVIAVTLPVDDDAAGLAEYTDAVVAALGDRSDRDDLVVVA